MSTHYSLAIITLTLAQFLAAASLREHSPQTLNPDDMYSELNYANTRTGYMPSWPFSREYIEERELEERSLPRNIPRIIPRIMEKLSDIEENIEDAPQEPLPVPAALIGGRGGDESKAPMKKDPGYHMIICHFKICNMGRKRNTRFLHYPKMVDNSRFEESPRSLMSM